MQRQSEHLQRIYKWIVALCFVPVDSVINFWENVLGTEAEKQEVSWLLLLYCTVLYCTVLYCTVLYCTVLYCTVLYCTVLYCTVMYCTVLYYSVLYFAAAWGVPGLALLCWRYIHRPRDQEHKIAASHPHSSVEPSGTAAGGTPLDQQLGGRIQHCLECFHCSPRWGVVNHLPFLQWGQPGRDQVEGDH